MNDLQGVQLYESKFSGDELIAAADDTPNYGAKRFLLGRAGFPREEASYRILQRMLEDETGADMREPLYEAALRKLGDYSKEQSLILNPGPVSKQRGNELRAFWGRTSFVDLKAMRTRDHKGE